MNELELLNGTEEIIPENIITKEQFVKFVENSVKFEELMMMYRCAIREVQTKLEILNDEFKTKRQRNPIDSIRSRIKSPLSIYEKLKRRNYPVSIHRILVTLLYAMKHRGAHKGLATLCIGGGMGCATIVEMD